MWTSHHNSLVGRRKGITHDFNVKQNHYSSHKRMKIDVRFCYQPIPYLNFPGEQEFSVLPKLPDSQSFLFIYLLMSTHSNPFIQGGWATSSSRPTNDQLVNPPSIFGALPMSSDQGSNLSSAHGKTTFQFTNPNPNILNSVVVGPHRDVNVHQLVKITTDEKLAGYTQFKDADGRSVALVEWMGGQPRVEVRGSVAKCSTGDWLKVVNDPTFGR